MRKKSLIGQHFADRSLSIGLAICCLVSISADRLIARVDAKKDKDKGKGGNMVIMMGGGYGGGKGGGYGGGGGGGYGRGGGGYPMPIPMPMPMFCPSNFGRPPAGGRKGRGGGGVREKIMIIPIPSQMLSGGEKGASFGGDGASYGGGGAHGSGGASGFGGESSSSGSFGGDSGSYDALSDMPAIMMPSGGGGGDYGGTSSRGYGGGGAKSGGADSGYGAASHAYAIELAPMNGVMHSANGMDSMDYPFDHYASGSSHQAAMSDPPGAAFGTTESGHHVDPDGQFDLQAAASGEKNPPTLVHVDLATTKEVSQTKDSRGRSGPQSEKRKPHRRRK